MVLQGYRVTPIGAFEKPDCRYSNVLTLPMTSFVECSGQKAGMLYPLENMTICWMKNPISLFEE